MNREANSFASLNKNSKILKNNTSIAPSDKHKADLLDYTPQIGMMTENHRNFRESFESWTTEGKKESIIPEFQSNSKPGDDSYGLIKNSKVSQNLKKLSSVEEGSYKSNKTKSKMSIAGSESIGDDSLPEICNSVVEDVLPFKGLENHYKAISKEGFSGANDTNYLMKTNENFYSSIKSKRNDNTALNPMLINDNGFPGMGENNHFEDTDNEISNFERVKTENLKKNLKSLSPLVNKSSIENTLNASSKLSPYSKKNLSIIKAAANRKENKSKASNKSDEQPWFSYEYSKPASTHNQYDGSKSNMIILSNPK